MDWFMSNGIRINFLDPSKPLPNDILIDSSVLLHLFFPAPKDSIENTLFRHSKDFLNRVKANKANCRAVIPIKVIDECFHKIMMSEVKTHTGLKENEDNFRELKRRPELLNQLNIPDTLHTFLKSIDTIGVEIIQPYDYVEREEYFEDQILANIKNSELLAGDAHILAAAQWFDIFDIASVDKDFKRILTTGVNIYTSSAIINSR